MATTVTTPAATTVTTGTPATVTETSLGKTVINDAVIAKIAGIAAREVPGVNSLGGGAARALGAIRDAINSKDLSQGIRVEVGETQVAVDISLVAEYPMSLQGVADDVRTAVIGAIETYVGMQVTEVNVNINDVHFPIEDDVVTESEARVQ